LQLPATALVQRGDGQGVLLIDGGHAVWRPVQRGLTGRDAVEILSGLDERNSVIASPGAGARPITDGQRVTATAKGGRP
jgi:hypothetical protein